MGGERTIKMKEMKERGNECESKMVLRPAHGSALLFFPLSLSLSLVEL